MAWVWVAGEASPGEFSLAGGVFFVVTTDKSRRHVLSDSAGAVSMFSPIVNWTFLLKKKTLRKLGKVSRPTCIFHVKISGLLPNQLKTYPFPLKEKKISFMLVFFFFFNSMDKNFILESFFFLRFIFLLLLVPLMRILVNCFLWICCWVSTCFWSHPFKRHASEWSKQQVTCYLWNELIAIHFLNFFSEQEIKNF